MYHEKMIGVCGIENGFLIEVRAPYKEEKEESDDKCCCLSNGMRYGEKEIYAKDAADLGKKIEALIPMLKIEFTSKDAFDAAFEAVSK